PIVAAVKTRRSERRDGFIDPLVFAFFIGGYNVFRLSDNRTNMETRFSKSVLELSDNRANPRTYLFWFFALSGSRPPVSSDRVETAVSFMSASRDRRLEKQDRRLVHVSKSRPPSRKTRPSSRKTRPPSRLSRNRDRRLENPDRRLVFASDETAVWKIETAVSSWR
ncbi:unnamed protein product, partial [Sphenostylis stenocarpa]